MGKIQACSLKKDVSAPELSGDFYERFYTHRTKVSDKLAQQKEKIIVDRNKFWGVLGDAQRNLRRWRFTEDEAVDEEDRGHFTWVSRFESACDHSQTNGIPSRAGERR